MLTSTQRQPDHVEPDTLTAELTAQYRAIATAADATNAEYLALRAVRDTRAEDLETIKRRWLLLERQRRTLAARLDRVDT